MLKVVYKPIGLTPYELTLKIKNKYPFIKKIAYVYRLDPMAHGEILILINDSCKLTNIYVKKNYKKIYEFTVLFGVKTDSLDIMGNIIENKIKNFNLNFIIEQKNNLVGEYFQEYPICSSKTVKIKNKMVPLWKLKDSNINFKIPKKRIKVDYIKYINHKELNKLQLINLVISRLNLVTSKNFNIKNFITQWKNIKNNKYFCIDFCSQVSSGTYIREISKQLGILCNFNSIILNIYRKKIILL